MKNITLDKYGIDKKRLPRHIAIIMDGNGRWAEKRGMPRIQGHKKGVESVTDIVETCGDIGIQYLTLYCFSEENWKRPAEEVSFLLQLFGNLLEEETPKLKKNNVKVSFIGRLERIPEAIRKEMEITVNETALNTGLSLILAISYSGRGEIIDAIRRMQSGGVKTIDENGFRKWLYQAIPDPDLLIRTSGELRISNFLLWQIAYTEIWVTKTLWPDFRTRHLLKAILDYEKRKRRFGRL